MKKTPACRHKIPPGFRCCLLALLFITGPVLFSQTRRALLIGIDIYQPGSGAVTLTPASPSPGRGSWQNLNGAVNDMKAMRDILKARYGFKPEHVRVLENDSATRKNILSAFRDHLIQKASPGDICLFFYAGHGSQVANSSTREEDGLDESLVPSDSYRGARDIRDKELWKLYNTVQEKGANLTVIVDSCHSGSISRGLSIPVKYRYLTPDLRDASDPTRFRETPAEKGALIISAAQDFEQAAEIIDEDRHNHGLFTWALLKTLRSVSVDEPADRILLRVKALMRSQGKTQEPNIEATPKRKKAPLFGIRSGLVSGRTSVAVQKVSQTEKRITFLGGVASGIRKGCELIPVRKTGNIRVRIIEVNGLSLSVGDVIKGDIRHISSGDLFQVDTWAVDHNLRLRVFMPKADFDFAELNRLSGQVYRIVKTKGISWVNDPSEQSPTHIMYCRGHNWMLKAAGTNPINLGSNPLQKLNHILADGKKAKIRFFLSLPPSARLRRRVITEMSGDDTLLAAVDVDHRAHYILTGQYRDRQIRYALLLPNVDGEQSDTLPLPSRTDWIGVEGSQKDMAGPAVKLVAYARQIMKIKAWLEISSPPDRARFPYYLALKDARTGKLKTGGVAYQGDVYGLVLRTDNVELSPNFDFHYVYVFSIDKFGRSILLYPNRLLGTIENKLPARFSDEGKLPEEIQLGNRELFGIGDDAFGVDTFILLTSLTPIPDPEVLHGEGVRTRGTGDPERGDSRNPVQHLLDFMSKPKRGITIISPSTWSIERISILSKPGKR
jgi:hypothetical protein